jgi:hypothetical protein
MAKHYFTLTCPYCGTNMPQMGYDTGGKHIVRCWQDGDIGCEKDFVIDVHITTTVLTYKLEKGTMWNGSVFGGGLGSQ